MKREHENQDYNVMPVNAFLSLMIKLLDLLPVFAAEIAPDGFNNCIYNEIYEARSEQVYKNYLSRQIKKFIANNCEAEPKEERIFLTKAEFLSTCILPEENFELDLLIVYISGISVIFNDAIVHDREGNSFKLYKEFGNCMHMATGLTSGVDAFYRMEQIFPEYDNEELDYQPVFRFIFSYLKSNGLDYHYINLTEEFRYELLEISLVDLPPVVLAYLEVYGHWPVGYI